MLWKAKTHCQTNKYKKMLNLKKNLIQKNIVIVGLLTHIKTNFTINKRISTSSSNNSYKEDHLSNFFYYNIIPNLVMLGVIKFLLNLESKKHFFKIFVSESMVEGHKKYLDDNTGNHVSMLENKINGTKASTVINISSGGNVEGQNVVSSTIFTLDNLKAVLGLSLLIYVCINQGEIIQMLSALKESTVKVVTDSSENILNDNAKNAANVISTVNNQSLDNNKTFEQIHSLFKRLIQMISNVTPKDSGSKGGSGNNLPSIGNNDWEK